MKSSGLNEFLTVRHASGAFRASASHVVFVNDGDKAVADLQMGDEVFVAVDGVEKASRVLSVTQDATDQGMFAPLTQSGTLIVDDVVASNYAKPRTGVHLPH